MNSLIHSYTILIASNFSLYMKTHNAHFNVTGMFFPQLHSLFKEQYIDLWEAHDTIGENMRKLDAFTPCSISDYGKFSLIQDFTGVLDAKGYVTYLLADHEKMISLLYKVFKFAEDANKQDHMNFIAERIDAHSKMRWFLKSLVNSVADQASPVGQVDVIVKL